MTEPKKIVLFALSTCPACKKTKELLKNHDIDYVLVEMDTIDAASREKLLIEVRKHNSRETFPTLVINGGEKVVVGYREDDLKDAIFA